VNDPNQQPVALSFVIPVFNGGASIGGIVERIHRAYADLDFEVVLVNDGSRDDSEAVCAELQQRHPGSVVFVHLARNFGEHAAVLAGLNQARGAYTALLDDDGQNPPEEVRRLYEAIRAGGHDVVYGRYRIKHHSLWRNLGSRFNDRVANVMLRKPRELYLSSFKILSRFIVDEVTRDHGYPQFLSGVQWHTLLERNGWRDVRRYRFYDRRPFNPAAFLGHPTESIALARQLYEREGALVITAVGGDDALSAGLDDHPRQ